jgi:CRISPR-associated endonuclease Csn1
MEQGKKQLPDFYRSDLQEEFNRIWAKQQEFYSEILTDKLKENLREKSEKATWTICKEPFNRQFSSKQFFFFLIKFTFSIN